MASSRRDEKRFDQPEVTVLRWGHRPHRDERLTAHVALAARALGASGIIVSDIEDKQIEETIKKVTRNWGGQFSAETGTAWQHVIRKWKKAGGIVVHLTAYGENIQTSNVLKRIRNCRTQILVIVGSQKVPREFYSKAISDFNVAVGNQPHSECSSLAIFLDRLFEGKTLAKKHKNAKIRIIPKKNGKKVIEKI